MEKIIEFKHVSKHYSQTFALQNVSFSILEGEFVVILGPSGSGKSTLLNLLGGMDYANSGEILVENKPITHYSDNQLSEYRAQKIGFIFQFYNLIPSLTALENVALIKEVVKDAQKSEKILRDVGLSQQLNQFPAQLSGGEQQRVSIARALCKNPLLLLCDEPTGALDTHTGVTILNLLKDMCITKKRTVIIVTHNVALAPCANRVLYLKNGQIEKIIVNEQPKAIDEVSW